MKTSYDSAVKTDADETPKIKPLEDKMQGLKDALAAATTARAALPAITKASTAYAGYTL